MGGWGIHPAFLNSCLLMVRNFGCKGKHCHTCRRVTVTSSVLPSACRTEMNLWKPAYLKSRLPALPCPLLIAFVIRSKSFSWASKHSQKNSNTFLSFFLFTPVITFFFLGLQREFCLIWQTAETSQSSDYKGKGHENTDTCEETHRGTLKRNCVYNSLSFWERRPRVSVHKKSVITQVFWINPPSTLDDAHSPKSKKKKALNFRARFIFDVIFQGGSLKTPSSLWTPTRMRRKVDEFCCLLAEV